MMNKKLALLGASHIHTPGFVNVLAARTDVSVAAIWDPDPAIAQKYAARLQCRVAPDVATVLGMADLDEGPRCRTQRPRHAAQRLGQRAVPAHRRR